MIKIRDFSCGSGLNCPALHPRENGRMIVTGPQVVDPDLLAELALPAGEAALDMPAEMFGLRSGLLDLNGLTEYVDRYHTRDLFRLETLTYYDADSEDFDRWRRGEPKPPIETKRAWLDRLRSDTEAGKRWRWLRTLKKPPSEYLRFECEWCYTDNVAAGEDIRIIDQATDVLLAVGDFFVLDGERVLRSHYDQEGRFVGAEVIQEAHARAPYLALSQAVWPIAQDFTHWWRVKHPEYRRASRVA